MALLELMPLHEDDKAAIFETLSATLSSVMRGLMLTALLDGVVIGLGYLICDVPYWALLALATAACGLLPLGGTAIVWAPVAVYLVIQSGWGAALLLVAWSLVALTIIDNFIKPVAMRHGTELPTVALFSAWPVASKPLDRWGFFLAWRLLRYSPPCSKSIAAPTCAIVGWSGPSFRSFQVVRPPQFPLAPMSLRPLNAIRRVQGHISARNSDNLDHYGSQLPRYRLGIIQACRSSAGDLLA